MNKLIDFNEKIKISHKDFNSTELTFGFSPEEKIYSGIPPIFENDFRIGFLAESNFNEDTDYNKVIYKSEVDSSEKIFNIGLTLSLTKNDKEGTIFKPPPTLKFEVSKDIAENLELIGIYKIEKSFAEAPDYTEIINYVEKINLLKNNTGEITDVNFLTSNDKNYVLRIKPKQKKNFRNYIILIVFVILLFFILKKLI